jgi:hypothetical protein
MTTTEDVARALTLVVRDLETAGVPAPAITWVEEWMTMGFPDGSVHGTDLSQVTHQAGLSVPRFVVIQPASISAMNQQPNDET